jgi:hypothetical protein
MTVGCLPCHEIDELRESQKSVSTLLGARPSGAHFLRHAPSRRPEYFLRAGCSAAFSLVNGSLGRLLGHSPGLTPASGRFAAPRLTDHVCSLEAAIPSAPGRRRWMLTAWTSTAAVTLRSTSLMKARLTGRWSCCCMDFGSSTRAGTPLSHGSPVGGIGAWHPTSGGSLAARGRLAAEITACLNWLKTSAR